MLKRSKVVALLATLAGGAALWQGCMNGFWSGWFGSGFVDNVWADVFVDWLNEDLFS